MQKPECKKMDLENGLNDSSRHIICLDFFFVLEESFQPYNSISIILK